MVLGLNTTKIKKKSKERKKGWTKKNKSLKFLGHLFGNSINLSKHEKKMSQQFTFIFFDQEFESNGPGTKNHQNEETQ